MQKHILTLTFLLVLTLLFFYPKPNQLLQTGDLLEKVSSTVTIQEEDKSNRVKEYALHQLHKQEENKTKKAIRPNIPMP